MSEETQKVQIDPDRPEDKDWIYNVRAGIAEAASRIDLSPDSVARPCLVFTCVPAAVALVSAQMFCFYFVDITKTVHPVAVPFNDAGVAFLRALCAATDRFVELYEAAPSEKAESK